MAKCDNCGKKRELKKVHIQTGKRGRPPIKFYCDTCINEAGSTVKLAERRERVQKAFRKAVSGAPNKSESVREPRRVGRPPRGSVNNRRLLAGGFDPACTFLLSMLPENLFEPTNSRESLRVRCKGCQTVIKLSERSEHFAEHKKAIAA